MTFGSLNNFIRPILRKNFKKIPFPSPFEIALILSLLSICWATFSTKPAGVFLLDHGWKVLGFWKAGFWDLLSFTLQMVMILVFGHALAVSRPVEAMLNKIAQMAQSNTQAVMITGSASLCAGYINWGFGLILGAVLAKKMGENSFSRNYTLNYPLVAAAGYTGMMVWHGGLSGSAPLTVAAEGHFLTDQMGVVPVSETLFSDLNFKMNLLVVLSLLVCFYLLSLKAGKKQNLPLPKLSLEKEHSQPGNKWGLILGGMMVVLAFTEFLETPDSSWAFIDLNYVNFLLLGIGLMLHQNLSIYVKSVEKGLKGASGIIIQFPFYAGILGVFKYSGLLVVVADYFVGIASPATFPILTFISAAVINVFVPSGGGQWAVQGPIIVESAQKMGLSIPKMVMVLSYGDQVTNMIQPFWALPLLAITGVPAREILRYTLWFFGVGALVFGLGIYFLF